MNQAEAVFNWNKKQPCSQLFPEVQCVFARKFTCTVISKCYNATGVPVFLLKAAGPFCVKPAVIH